MVRSALKSVVYAYPPSRFMAAAIFFVTSVPAGRPNSSPSVFWMAGAICHTTVVFGSSRASITLRMAPFSVIAATGQTFAH